MKLYYFDSYGRAEAIRMFFWHAKVEYEDIRLTKEQFAEHKAAGKFEYGQVPMLELDDGTQLTQTNAIMRYVSEVYGYGVPENCPPEAIYKGVHLSCYFQDDFAKKYLMPVFYAQEEDKAVLAQKLFGEGVP